MIWQLQDVTDVCASSIKPTLAKKGSPPIHILNQPTSSTHHGTGVGGANHIDPCCAPVGRTIWIHYIIISHQCVTDRRGRWFLSLCIHSRVHVYVPIPQSTQPTHLHGLL